MNLTEILAEDKKLKEEQKQLKHEVIQLAWFMRGGCNLEEAFSLSPEDREIISGIVKNNMETTKKSGLPFF